MTDVRTQLLVARHRMVEQLIPDANATSIDGRAFTFVGPVEFDVPIGGYVEITTRDGRHLLGLVNAKRLAERTGPQVRLGGDAGLLGDATLPAIAESVFTINYNVAQGGGTVLADLEGGVPTSSSSELPFDAAAIASADAAVVAAYLEKVNQGKRPLDIGSVRNGDASSRASIQATGFDRHTFLCGQSGSGKTYALGVILERLLLETDLKIAILDPNSDFVNLNSSRSFEAAARGFKGQLDSAGDYEPLRARYQEAGAGVKVFRPSPHGVANQNALRVHFSALPAAVQGMALKLDPLADQEEFNAFMALREKLSYRTYTLGDIRHEASYQLSPESRSLALRIMNLGLNDWDVWAERDEEPILGSGTLASRVIDFDIGGFSNPDEQALVSLAVLDHVWRNRSKRNPLLLVIDEAHTVCPAEPTSRMQAEATRLAVQIAGEGRKYGIYLLVSTQRPQKLHPNVISQCDNLVLMRMNSEADIAQLQATFSFVPPALLGASSSFTQGESLIAGKLVPSPVMVRFGGRFSQEGGGDVPTDWARTT